MREKCLYIYMLLEKSEYQFKSVDLQEQEQKQEQKQEWKQQEQEQELFHGALQASIAEEQHIVVED